MGTNYVEELVYTTADDGVTLEGAIIRPSTGSSQDAGIIWVHGLTGKFYGRTAVLIGRMLAGRGFTFITGNNRGHDFGFVLRRTADGQVTLGGGGWERFSESPLDVAAWIDVAMAAGVRGVLLVGHSLGALKVGYYQALRRDPRVLGIVAVSPPGRASRIDPELLAQAERMVAEGRGQDLLPWGISPAGAGTHSAQTYVDRARTNLDIYGFSTPDPLVARLRCPLFACYGSEEAWVGGAAELEVIRRTATGAPRVETRLFQGADHSYAGHEAALAEAIAGWAAAVTATRPGDQMAPVSE
jgi:pimeloyl-ACP methyl ester carboxylesterase